MQQAPRKKWLRKGCRLVEQPGRFLRVSAAGGAGAPEGVADIALLRSLVARAQRDNDYSTAADEVNPVARTLVNFHLRNFALDRLPVSETSCFCLT
jgi:hypothetical protein